MFTNDDDDTDSLVRKDIRKTIVVLLITQYQQSLRNSAVGSKCMYYVARNYAIFCGGAAIAASPASKWTTENY